MLIGLWKKMKHIIFKKRRHHHQQGQMCFIINCTTKQTLFNPFIAKCYRVEQNEFPRSGAMTRSLWTTEPGESQMNRASRLMGLSACRASYLDVDKSHKIGQHAEKCSLADFITNWVYNDLLNTFHWKRGTYVYRSTFSGMANSRSLVKGSELAIFDATH